MRSLLVTGGAGFIGSNFVRYWFRQHPGDRVVVLDALTYAGHELSLADVSDQEGFHFAQGDIRDAALLDATFREHAIDTVVHFAAESHVDRSIDGPDIFFQTNVLGTHELLKVARTHWEGRSRESVRFHHVSTDEVFGSLGADDPAFTEETPYKPNSPYSASKAASDHAVRAYHHSFGLPVTISNCTNNYGPFQIPEKLIPLMIFNAIEGRSLPVYGDGLNVRDWLYVEDHCRAIEAIVHHGEVGDYYTVGGDCELTNLELVHKICDLLDEMVPPEGIASYRDRIEFVKDRPGHDQRYAIDHSKLTEETGWLPQTTLEAGLSKTIRWYLDNPRWVAAVGGKEIASSRRGLK